MSLSTFLYILEQVKEQLGADIRVYELLDLGDGDKILETSRAKIRIIRNGTDGWEIME